MFRHRKPLGTVPQGKFNGGLGTAVTFRRRRRSVWVILIALVLGVLILDWFSRLGSQDPSVGLIQQLGTKTLRRFYPRQVRSFNDSCPRTRMDMFRYMTAWLERNEIPYFPCYGTLLGLVRERRLLPWTGDIDFCIPNLDVHFEKFADPEKFALRNSASTDWSGMDCFEGKPNEAVFHLLSKHPEVERVEPWWKVWELNCYIDVYGVLPEYQDGEQVYYVVASRLKRRVHPTVLFPLKPLEVNLSTEVFHLMIPSYTEALLEWEYGSDWRTPDPLQRTGYGLEEGRPLPALTVGPRSAGKN